MARIGFCGTVSVGKTTLVNELAKLPQFKDYKITTERSKYLRDLGIPLNTDSTLEGQTIFLAERASELLNSNIITDRTVLDVMAFTKCAKSITHYEKEAYIQYAAYFLNKYDYIFYVSPNGVEIEDNDVRETNAEYRDLIDFSIQNLIRFYSHKIKKITHIEGTIENRIKTVIETINF